MHEGFKPLLAATAEDLEKLAFPLIASPKLDGIRCLIHGRRAWSRNMKLLPNKHVQSFFWDNVSDKVMLDGEIVAGNVLSPQAFNQTQSEIMSVEGKPKFTLWVFDDWSKPTEQFQWRLLQASMFVREKRLVAVKILEHKQIKSLEELVEYERVQVELGFEGVMLRSPAGHYKFGRSTLKESILLKVKRFADSEARVLGSYELMQNANEQTTDELGRPKRSSHQAGMVGKGMLGGFHVQDIHTGIEFDIGTGFNDTQRKELWANADAWIGKVLTYKFQPAGAKDKPRFPVFKGWRLEVGN